MKCLPSMGLWVMLLPSQVDGSLQEWCKDHAIPVGLWSDLARGGEIRVTPVRHHRFLADYFLFLFLAEPNFCATEPD